MPICATVKEIAFMNATASPPVSAPDIEVQIAEAARFARRHLIASIYRATSGHPGGALSCADIMACLFGAESFGFGSGEGPIECVDETAAIGTDAAM